MENNTTGPFLIDKREGDGARKWRINFNRLVVFFGICAKYSDNFFYVLCATVAIFFYHGSNPNRKIQQQQIVTKL